MFDLNRFNAAAFTPRQRSVDCPELRFFFHAGAAPVWVVRGLTGEEIAFCNEAAERGDTARAFLDALLTGTAEEKAQSVRGLLGLDGSLRESLAKRIEYLTVGSVEPAIDRATAIRLFAFYPVVGFRLFEEIVRVTAEGQNPGKLNDSGETPASESL